jgi:hypothetical protein
LRGSAEAMAGVGEQRVHAGTSTSLAIQLPALSRMPERAPHGLTVPVFHAVRVHGAGPVPWCPASFP